ncbi:sugar ABC transporter permease [Brevibacillus humidisoli]|uniref:carbohydrate ABC transporter permease n=1 Tax=Brevibacillus humidisoli TaxID=2895522 RepID=UPI001E4F0D8C|nr:sugar ABC transporter permease [Brevibacillus humidisoli]UFJ39397.1 sugar ABC transporter permease [Brevibacillus humidisoli]
MATRSNWWIAYLFLAPVIVVMALLVFYPLLQGVIYSFTNMTQYNMGSKFAPASWEFIGLKHYIDLFSSMLQPESVFRDVIIQTLIWTFVNVFFHFTIGLILALLLNRNIRGRGIYRMVLVVPWAVPSFISAFSWTWMYNQSYGVFNILLAKLGFAPIPWLGDSFWAMVSVIIVNIWIGVPFMMITLLGGLQGIPQSLYEAARVDGATPWRQFWTITLPLLKPVAATATVLGVIWTFNMFNIIYLVTRGGPARSTQILVTYAYQEGFMNWNFGLAATYGVVILSFLLAFTLLYQRLLKENSNEGVYY